MTNNKPSTNKLFTIEQKQPTTSVFKQEHHTMDFVNRFLANMAYSDVYTFEVRESK